MHLLQKYDGKPNFTFTCIYLSGLYMFTKSKYPIKHLSEQRKLHVSSSILNKLLRKMFNLKEKLSNKCSQLLSPMYLKKIMNRSH